jgi:hypothetical protein
MLRFECFVDAEGFSKIYPSPADDQIYFGSIINILKLKYRNLPSKLANTEIYLFVDLYRPYVL